MEHRTIDLGFRPRPWQLKALSSLKRFSVLIVHRRGGKTLGAVMKLIDAALRCTRQMGRYAFIAPELKQAKTAAWDYIKHYALKVPGTKVDSQELYVEFPNGARVRIFGADNPDSLRGAYYDGVVLDEVAQMKPETWGEVLVPALADRHGWALIIGTPKGTNLLSERYVLAQQDPSWYADLFTIDDTQALSEAELAEMRATMTDRQWRQEMLCDFNASSEEALITLDDVRSAMGRVVPEHAYTFAARVIGVDVALGGADRTVIVRRQGLRVWEPQVLNYDNSQDIGDTVALHIDAFRADACFVDDSGGYGDGVISRLRGLGFDPIGVKFGDSARDERYQDRSAEMWVGIREWLKAGGCLPRQQQWLIDLTGRLYSFDNARGKLTLESKKQMRARGLKSPDWADALALTFASIVYPKVPAGSRVVFGNLSGELARPIETFLQHTNAHTHEYDPYQRFRKEQERLNE